MSVTITPFLSKVLVTDAVVSAAAGLLMAAGASLLGRWLEIPSGLLFWAGLVLFPWAAMLLFVARRDTAPRLVLLDIVLANLLWVAASFGIMLAGLIAPNGLGIAFVSAQALAVLALAAMQQSGLRVATRVAA